MDVACVLQFILNNTHGCGNFQSSPTTNQMTANKMEAELETFSFGKFQATKKSISIPS